MTHEININGIIIRLRNLSASLNKLIKTQKIMPNEKEKVINKKYIKMTCNGSLGIASKPNHNNPKTSTHPTTRPIIASRIKRATKVAKGVSCR